METEDVNKLESLMYMSNSKRDVITYILGNSSLDVNKKLFESYCDEYTLAYLAYVTCKGEISHLYLKKLYDVTNDINWTIDFASEIMEVTSNSLSIDEMKEILYGDN